jgi:two-component sensor histidine kinase
MEGNGGATSMMHLVEQSLGSFGDRVVIKGSDVYLSAVTAQGFALILHELATNAVKHGALGARGGTVTVTWCQKANSPDVLFFGWREAGGPPAEAPQRRGFGTKLLEIAVPTVETPRFDYSANGLVYESVVVLDSIHPKMKLPTRDAR